jgi:phospholipid N-methyltransferase
MIQFVIIFLASLTTVSILITSVKNGISPMPTSPRVKQLLVEVLANESPKRIAELGAGWGSLAFPIAKNHPYSTVVAYENSLLPYFVMNLRKILFPTPNLIILRKNFYTENLSSYDLLVCYLFPQAMTKLRLKFSNELNPSASIYTHTFSIPYWKPKVTWEANDLYRTKIFLYKS